MTSEYPCPACGAVGLHACPATVPPSVTYNIRVVIKGPMTGKDTAHGLRYLNATKRQEFAARVQVRDEGGEWVDVPLIEEPAR
jgi:hypothetical protein